MSELSFACKKVVKELVVNAINGFVTFEEKHETANTTTNIDSYIDNKAGELQIDVKDNNKLIDALCSDDELNELNDDSPVVIFFMEYFELENVTMDCLKCLVESIKSIYDVMTPLSYNDKCNAKYLNHPYLKWIVDMKEVKTIKEGLKVVKIIDCNDINILKKYSDLQSITFGTYFNQPITALEKCTQLQSVTFKYCFNQPITALEKCTQLQSVTFGHYFNQPITALEKCAQLRSVTFGYMFNQPVTALEKCTQLQSVTFGYMFNKPITALVKCTQLQSVTFGYMFNRPITALEKCTQLQLINLKKGYKHTALGNLHNKIQFI